MGTLTTALVGLNVQTLAPAPVAGAQADSVLIVNLDTANTVNLGSSSTNLAYPLGPLASAVLTAPVYAAAATVPLLVGIAPGGTGYSPGALTITGPVTATITGPVEAEISGTADVNVTNATIEIIGGGGYVLAGQIQQVYQPSAAVTVAPNSLTALGVFNVSTYASLDFSFTNPMNSSTASGAGMCMGVYFLWGDAGGNVLGRDFISVIQGAQIYGNVPCQGAVVEVQLYNPGSVGTMKFNTDGKGILIDGSSRASNAIHFSESIFVTNPTFSGLTVEPFTGPVGFVNGWVANIQATGLTAGNVYMWPFPLFNGPVSGWYQVITDALDNDAVIIDLSFATVGGVVAGTGNNALLQNLPSGILANPDNISYISPPSQLALIAKPSNSAGGLFLTLTGQG